MINPTDWTRWVSDAIIATNTSLAITAWNEAASRMYGWSAEEALGQNIDALLKTEFMDVTQAEAQTRLAQTGVWRGPVCQQAKDGRKLYIEAAVTLLRDAAENIVGGITVNRDLTARQQAESQRAAALAALRESEVKFRAVFEHSVEAIGVAQRGTHVFVNPAYLTLFGYDRPAELVGRPILDLIAPEQQERITEQVRRRASGEPAPTFYETRGRRKDGTPFDMETRLSTYELNGETYTLVILRDITERKRAEEQLRASEQKFRIAMQESLDGFVLVDGQGVIVEWNSANEQISSLSHAEVMGRYYWDVQLRLLAAEKRTPTALARYRSQIEQALRTGEAPFLNRVLEMDFVQANGEKRAIRQFVRAIKTAQGFWLAGTTHDFTERKRAEDEVRLNKANMAAIVENTLDSIWAINTQYEILYTNQVFAQAFLAAFGVTLAPGINLLQSLPEALRPAWQEKYDRAFGGERFVFVDQVAAGEVVIHVEVAVNPIVAGGQVVGASFFGRDITARQQAEAVQRQLEEKFSKAFHISPDAININRLQDGLYLDINEGFVAMTGYTAAEAIGKTSLEINIWADPKDRERLVAGLRAQGEVQNLEAWFRIKNGQLKRCLMSAKMLEINQEPCLLSITRDITELRRVEDDLRASEQRFRALFETMAQGVVYQDAAGQIISANPAAERILGLSLGQLQGRTSSDPRWHAIHEDGSDFPGETHPAMLALHSGQSINNVIMGVFHPTDGNYVWINVNAMPLFRPGETAPYQVYATFEDISARKRNDDIRRARLHLIESAATHTTKELLQAILDEAGALVFSPIGFYHLVDLDQDALTLQAWSTRTQREFCTAVGEDRHYPIAEAGVWADAARERRPIIHNDYAALGGRHGLPAGHATLSRELVVPVMRGGQIRAIMGFGNKPDEYNATDLEIVAALADFSWDIIQQRKALDELSASEEQYRRLINVLPSGVVVHCQGRITLVNRAGLDLLGAADAGQVIGTTLLDRVHPDSRAVVRERVRQSQEQGQAAELIEEKILRLDGTVFDAEVATIPVNYAGRPSTLVVFNDITSRKQRERELEAIAALSSALRAAPGRAEMLPVIVDQIVNLFHCESAAMAIIDSQTGEAIIEAARGIWQSLIGLRQPPEAGLPGVLAAPLIAQEKRLGFIWLCRPTDLGKAEDRLLTSVADIAANAIHRATLYEQTQQDAAALEQRVETRTAELARERERLRAMLDAMGEGVVFTDLAGTIEYINPAMERLTGFTAQESLGQQPRLWQSGLTPPAVYQQMRETLARGEIWQGELVNRRQDGRLYEAALTAAALADPVGQIVGFVWVQHDITRQKELDRLKDQFVSNVSHELRTPLANIILNLQLLERGNPDKRSQYQATVRREVERLKEMIEDLLDLSRLDRRTAPVQLEPLNVHDLLGPLVADRMTLATEHGLTLEFLPTAAASQVLAEASMLTQVISNLLINALNYTPAGGSVTVQTYPQRAAAQDWLTLTVRDTGPGIPAHELPRLFERFYRGEVGRKAKTPGTGLGLAITKAIMEQLGGRITVESEPGQGAAFTVWLPLASDRASAQF